MFTIYDIGDDYAVKQQKCVDVNIMLHCVIYVYSWLAILARWYIMIVKLVKLSNKYVESLSEMTLANIHMAWYERRDHDGLLAGS